jgi:DNA-directed RNA polymerase specialized sigma24 family protein
MNVDQFWKIIDSSRSGFDPDRIDGNMEQQREELRRLLLKLPPEEIIDFHNHFVEQMNKAFHWDLWGAAYIIAGGCSDDGFSDFRSWLISMGRRVFEDAVSNAESLVDVVDAPGVEDVFFEALQYVPAKAYEELTGRELPAYAGPSLAAPAGDRWSEEKGNLEQRFPKLWARYQQG